MNCEECWINITPYIDDELDEITKKEVTSHLDLCKKCKNLYKSERAVKFLVQKRMNKVSAPEDLRKSLEENIGSGFTKKDSSSLNRRILSYVRPLTVYATAAIIVVAIISYLMFRIWQKNEVDLAKIHLPADFIYASKSENKISLTGTVVCICCEMKRDGAHSQCKKYGHMYGLKTDNGVLWTIMKNDKGIEIIDHSSLIGTRVKITGWFHLNSNYVDIEEFMPIDYANSNSQTIAFNK
jgi:mycothiol system anti-sigma-R factor